MAVVVLVPHPERPSAAALAREGAAWLAAADHEVRVPAPEAGATGLEVWAHAEADVSEGADLAVSLGGDGTMLRAVRLAVDSQTPVLGVNLGHLGYLTEVGPDDLIPALQRFLAGDYQVERRMALTVEIHGPDGVSTETALNEAVLEKTVSGHTVRLAAHVNDQPFVTYAADGLIVATPTGSTAYNLSVRGPIASPGHRALLVTPVSPHMLFDRPLVLDPSETIRLEVAQPRPAMLVVDGRSLGSLSPGQAVVCRAADRDVGLVTFGARNFHALLKAKFGLADR